MRSPESDAVEFIAAMLWGLKFNVEAWDAALKLYQFAKHPPESVKRDLARKWKFIAIHECVMQLSYLQERLWLIRHQKLPACRGLYDHVDKQRLSDAENIFETYFPEMKLLRHAIAHMSTVDSVPKQHAPDGKYALFRIGDDDRF